jgi:hypothetical protein
LERARALFPKQNTQAFAAALGALENEMNRLKGAATDPNAVQMAFTETVRIRESVFRFGEVRTILTENPEGIAHELFHRYVRMEGPAPNEAELATA